jgi:peptidoglycan hydrolase CwlO-like protein
MMRRNPARVLRRALTGVVAVTVVVFAAPASASEITDAQARLDQLRTQIAANEAVLAERHQRLDALQVRIAAIVAAGAGIRDQLAEVRPALDVAERELAEVEAWFHEVIRAAYERGPLAPAAAVLGATSMLDLADGLHYVDSIARANRALAGDLEARTARLMAIRATAETLASATAAQEIRLRAKEAALLDELDRQQGLLAELAATREEAAQLVSTYALPTDPELTGAGVSYGRWAELLLGRLGAPACQDNLSVLVAWQAAEGTAAAHNPLATTHDVSGATDFNAVGVKNFPSLEAGLQASIETLHGPETYGYGEILSALASCTPAMTTAQAINASSWCKGCAGGMYVLNVVPLVQSDYERFAVR